LSLSKSLEQVYPDIGCKKIERDMPYRARKRYALLDIPVNQIFKENLEKSYASTAVYWPYAKGEIQCFDGDYAWKETVIVNVNDNSIYRRREVQVPEPNILFHIAHSMQMLLGVAILKT
jgi:hypothetical protein